MLLEILNMNNLQGWINLYKPKYISSFQAINKLKKKFLFKKIGHAGTLDPLAEGILPVAVGKTTKLIPFISNNYKTYLFTITWGLQTTTDDNKGEIIYRHAGPLLYSSFKNEVLPLLKSKKND